MANSAWSKFGDVRALSGEHNPSGSVVTDRTSCRGSPLDSTVRRTCALMWSREPKGAPSGEVLSSGLSTCTVRRTLAVSQPWNS